VCGTTTGHEKLNRRRSSSEKVCVGMPEKPIATKAKQRMKTNVSRAKPGCESTTSERIIETMPRTMSAIRGQVDAR